MEWFLPRASGLPQSDHDPGECSHSPAARAQRREEQAREKQDMALIFLTAHGDELTVARAASLYPDGYLVKPVEREKLENTITAALRSREARSRAGMT